MISYSNTYWIPLQRMDTFVVYSYSCFMSSILPRPGPGAGLEGKDGNGTGSDRVECLDTQNRNLNVEPKPAPNTDSGRNPSPKPKPADLWNPTDHLRLENTADREREREDLARAECGRSTTAGGEGRTTVGSAINYAARREKAAPPPDLARAERGRRRPHHRRQWPCTRLATVKGLDG
jgi:hypothetical protein